MASLWIRSSRRRSFLGFAMALQRTAARAEGVADAGEAQQFLCAPDGVGRPRFFLFFIRIIYFRLRGARLRLVQVVEIFANLPPVASRPPGVTHEIAESVGSPGPL